MTIAPRDYRDRSGVLSQDFLTMLNTHPDAFDCLVYKAIRSTAEDTVAGLVDDVVGALEGSERKIDYADPEQARAMLIPEEGFLFGAYSDGTGEVAATTEQPLVLLLSVPEVPKQSAVAWKEQTGQGAADVKDVAVYILESKAFGKAPVVGEKHYCIPFGDMGELE
jgi:hypothetical protein